MQKCIALTGSTAAPIFLAPRHSHVQSTTPQHNNNHPRLLLLHSPKNSLPEDFSHSPGSSTEFQALPVVGRSTETNLWMRARCRGGRGDDARRGREATLELLQPQRTKDRTPAWAPSPNERGPPTSFVARFPPLFWTSSARWMKRRRSTAPCYNQNWVCTFRPAAREEKKYSG
jgi:hypothetical protein